MLEDFDRTARAGAGSISAVTYEPFTCRKSGNTRGRLKVYNYCNSLCASLGVCWTLWSSGSCKLSFPDNLDITSLYFFAQMALKVTGWWPLATDETTLPGLR
jgi:hypothetical protein